MTASVVNDLALLTTAPQGLQRLREMIWKLAICGRLTSDTSDGWRRCQLGDLGQWGSGGTPLKTHPEYYGGEIPWLVIGDLNDGVVTSAQQCITAQGLANSSAKVVPPGTILIAMYGSIGKLGIAGFTCATNQAIAHCQVNPALATERYLFILLRSMRNEFLARGQGLAQQNISQKILKSADVILPPLDVQHRIVAKVDELMALCDRLEAEQTDAEVAHAKLVEALLASLTQARDAADFRASWQQLAEHFHTLFTTEASVDALKQTIVHLAVMGKLVASIEGGASASDFLAEIDAARAEYEAMPGQRSRLRVERGEPMVPPPYPAPAGWEWRNLGSLLLITGGVTLGRKLAGREVASLPYLRVANVQRGFLVLDQVKEVEVPADEVEKYKLAPGDLLTTEGGDWDKVGRTAIWRGEIAQCLHQNHVFRSRPYTEKFSSRWVELYLNSPPARDYFAGSSKQTTNLASINMTQLRACAFPVPPLAEQQRIVAVVDDLLALCDQLKLRMIEAGKHHEQVASELATQAVA